MTHKKPGKPKKFTAEEVATAITDAKGILAQAARVLGCTRSTVGNYMESFATVKAAFEEANETTIDFVESQLLKNVNRGDTASIIFFLKTKGKKRGYVERQEIEHGGTLQVAASVTVYMPENNRHDEQ